MKKLSNKLFQDLKLENSTIVKVIGGRSMNTSVGSDTNSSGGGYDISYDTLNSSGQSTGVDSTLTSPPGAGTLDKPGDC